MNECSNTVVSSRIRLARNVAAMPFPHKLAGERAISLIKTVCDAFDKADDFKTYFMPNLSDVERRAFVEKHLISLNLAEKGQLGAVMINDDQSLSVMINEEDHIREQCIMKGLGVREAFDKLKPLDEKLISSLPLAYDDTLGFLTSCPTNLGTGMRASVMMFLPFITRAGQIQGVIDRLHQKRHVTVRGVFGEGSKSYGYLYQISNEISLGVSEEYIISLVDATARDVAEIEAIAAQEAFKADRITLTDNFMRSKGILTNAYVMNTGEFFEHFANVKCGVALGVIKCSDMRRLDDLWVNAQPANIMLNRGAEMSETERDLFRAQYVKEQLNEILI